MMTSVLTTLFLSLSGTVFCDLLQSEPVCSKYDYEEKLLAKTIQLGSTVKELVKDKRDMEAKFEDELQKMGGKIERLDAYIKKIEMKMEASEEQKGQPKTCPSSYVYDDQENLCWLLQKGLKLNWFEARENCANMGAHLMILNTTAAIKIMQNYQIAIGADDVYVGAHDMIEEGTFKWVNGETVQQLPWYPGEPGSSSGENCLVMDNRWEGNFFDRTCSTKHEFLCQIFV